MFDDAPSNTTPTLPEASPSSPTASALGELPSLAPAEPATPDAAPPPEKTWYESLPATLRNEASVQQFKEKSVADVVKSYVHAQRAIGRDKISIPGEHASQDERDSFYARLGRPDSPDGYEFTQPGPSSHLEVPPDLVDDFRRFAHKSGMSKEHAESAYAWYLDRVDRDTTAAYDEAMEYQQASTADLQAEWGGSYEQKLNAARRVAREFGGDEFVNLMNETRLGDNATIIRTLARIGSAMDEDMLRGPGGTGESLMLSPTDARSRIAELRADPEFMTKYTERTNPAHENAVREMQRLYQLAFPDADSVSGAPDITVNGGQSYTFPGGL